MSIEHSRILVVEGDSFVRERIAAALRPNGLTVDEVSHKDQAIEMLHEHSYSVVLLDLVTAAVDGVAVLDAVKYDGPHAPVVLVVTGGDGRLLERLDPRRIHGVVRTPFDARELAAMVAACAEIRARSTFETMAFATMMSTAPLIALL